MPITSGRRTGAATRACRAVRNENKDVSFRRQVEIFIDLIDEGLSDRLPESAVDEIERSYADSFFDYPPRFHDSTKETLEAVRGMGLGIGLISNTGMTPGYTFREFLARHGLLEYFERADLFRRSVTRQTVR